jgi:hypothetical protein
MQPKYPIYIISKGRWESRQTSRALERMNVPYSIVVEESEYDNYAAVIDPKKIIKLPKDFRQDPRYAIPDELGQMGGGIPARNFVWEHSKALGHKRHWIMDDNIQYFARLNRNKKIRLADGTGLRCVEDFTDRYENVPMSGLQYQFFCPAAKKRPPYYINVRVYSCILLSNDLDLRWRGKYNEDTDLSLRILKDGHCTLLFNQFLCAKTATMTMKGGNTEEIYQKDQAAFDNRATFAKTLKYHHPDVTEVDYRWGRVHHVVDYSGFIKNNKLVLKSGLNIPRGPNEHGMKLIEMKAPIAGDAADDMEEADE